LFGEFCTLGVLMNVRRVVLALASLLLLTLSVPAFASPRIVRLSYVAGDVRIDRNKTAGVEQAILNMPVVEGTRIYSVGDDARVEIEFENGSTMRMVGNGELAFRQLGSIDNGDKQSVVDMVKGTAYFDVKNHNGDDFRVMLHDRDVTVRKSSHFRIQLEEPETTVAVFNGELELEGQADRVLVKKNETLSLQSDDHSRYFLAKAITTVEGDSFDQERLQYIANQAQSNAYRYAGVSYGDPYSYGVADMASYGSYGYYPGYGYLWRPAGFGIGWDPFGFGAWSYYSGPGWVFVSSYPWGWTPFRYGRWVNVPGRGWCWGPYGGYRRGWYPVPVVVGYGRGGVIQRGHGPIPVPWVRPPQQIHGGHTVGFGGGGVLVTHRDGHDVVIRPNQGPNTFARTEHFDGQNQIHGQAGRPGRVDDHTIRTEGQVGGTVHNGDFSHGGRPAGNSIASPNGGISVQGGALTTPGGAITSPGGAITTPGRAITTPGGAITTPGGAVRPVVPGVNRVSDDGRDADLGNRRNGHNTLQTWQAPPVSNPTGAPAVTGSQAPAVAREPHSFERGAVRDTPGERMGAPAVTAPVQRQSVPSAPAVSMPVQRQSAPPVTAPIQRQSVPSAPAVSMPVQRQSAPPVTAPRDSTPAPRSAPSAAPSRSPQSSHMSAPAMRGGGSSGFASHGGGASMSSHGNAGGGHSGGGSSNSRGRGKH
jgi:hypothetical protein